MEVLHYEFKGMLYDEWELNKTYITSARTIREAEIVNYVDLSGKQEFVPYFPERLGY